MKRGNQGNRVIIINYIYSGMEIVAEINVQLDNRNPENQTRPFFNPVCFQTYKALPRIYGTNKKKLYLFSKKQIQAPRIPPRHHCCSFQQLEEIKSKSRENLHRKNNNCVERCSPEASSSLSKRLSQPRTKFCGKKYCICVLNHDKSEQRKSSHGKLTKMSRGKIQKIKLPQLTKINQLGFMPDDKQSRHKVLRTEPSTSLAEGVPGFDYIIGFKRINLNVKSSLIEEYTEEHIEDQLSNKRTAESREIKMVKETAKSSRNQYESNTEERQQTRQQMTGEQSRHRANPLQKQPTKRSTHSQSPGDSTSDNRQIKQLKYRYKPRFKGRIQDDRITPRKSSDQQDQTLLNRANQDRNNRFKAEVDDSESITSKKSDGASISSMVFKSQKQKDTVFKKNNSKQEQLTRLNKSRARSILSNGLFRIPEEEQFGEYLSHYSPMTKEFQLKELIKKPTFQIIPFNKGVYFGQVQSQMKHGQGLLLTEKEIFEGKFKHNYRVSGFERNIDGIFRGQYLNGQRSGQGVFEWNNGQSFEGEWKQGSKNGFGIWKSPNGDYYQGQWVLNRQNGNGVHRHKTSTYKGQFKDSLKHGKGEEFFNNGDRYIGQYVEGKPHGQGKYEWSEGGCYVGQFIKGIRQGLGKWIDSAGNVYQGSFINDFKHGLGIEKFKTGQKFEGQFIEGVQNKGKLTSSDGYVIEIK